MTCSSFSSNEDIILFGSSSDELSDEFGDCVDAALLEGVHSLPMIQSTSSISMLESLRRAYYRNIDIFQGFLHRNVFSIANLSKTRRSKIIQAFLNDNHNLNCKNNPNNMQDTFLTNTTTTITATTITMTMTNNPSLDSIPTTNDRKEMEDSLSSLRDELATAKQRRNELQAKLHQLSLAQEALPQSANSTTNTTTVHSAVTAMIMGKQKLENLIDQAKENLETMDQEKRQRVEVDEDNEPKKTKLTLEAQYEQDKQIKTCANIQHLKEIFQEQK